MSDTSSFRTVSLSEKKFEREGLRFLTVKTPNLQGRGDLCVFIPEEAEGLSNLPIYILLHGVYGSAWVWAMKGGAHLTAQRLIKQGEIQPAILAMPSDGLWGDGSAYFSHHGKNFGQWIVSDVPLVIRETFPEAGPKSALCIGGLSMGGYGALLLGSSFPHLFSAVSGHSAITRLEEMALFVEEPMAAYREYAKTPDIIDVIKAHREQLPPLRFDCGTEDLLIKGNRLFRQQLQAENIPHTYQEFSGEHEWPYWEKHVEKTLRFFDHHTG